LSIYYYNTLILLFEYMPVAQSPDHYINSSKGCPSITESFPLVVFLVLCATVAALPVVQPHYPISLFFLDS
jgi:hypothetical protein